MANVSSSRSANSNSDAVMAAVRVRPLNDREKRSRIVVNMDADSCWLLEEKEPAKGTDEPGSTGGVLRQVGKAAGAQITASNKFRFDHCLWSIEGVPDQSGKNRFFNQASVYQEIGRLLLDHVFKGYNVCLFAYGQSGSGKTHTMMGDTSSGVESEERGIIPRMCADMFQRIEAKTNEATTFVVHVTYVELYNDQVCDLLTDKHDPDMKVREDPKTGPFVAGLTIENVTSVETVIKLIVEGNSRRHVAATMMNKESSRSHAILTLFFKEEAHGVGAMEVAATSRVNLVDLAGSENITKSGAQGDTLREAISINLSLTSLRKVIDALANPEKRIQPLYRDSKLTYLLKDSLGNNAKTLMLATLSPSGMNLAETKNTLHYASLARAIRNKATANQDGNIKLVRDLQNEVAALRDRLKEQDLCERRRLTPEKVEAMMLQLKEAQEEQLKKKMEQLRIERQLKVTEDEEVLRASTEEKEGLHRERILLEQKLSEGRGNVSRLNAKIDDLTSNYKQSRHKLEEQQKGLHELVKHKAQLEKEGADKDIRLKAAEEEIVFWRDARKARVRNVILQACLGSQGVVRRQLQEAIGLISESDFPKLWPNLVSTLIGEVQTAFQNPQGNLAHISSIFQILHAVLRKYREIGELTDEIGEELKPLCATVLPCVHHVLKWAVQELQSAANQANASLLQQILQLIDSNLAVFVDLTWVDLSDYLDQDGILASFMGFFLSILKYHNDVLITPGEDQEGPLEHTRATCTELITMFVSKHDDDFEEYLHGFAEAVWNLLATLPSDPKYDKLVIASMDFLSACARGIYHTVFQNPGILSTVCDNIVLPNIKVRDVDVVMFEDDPEEYIQRDIEGSDQFTRRRSACELMHSISKNYQAQMTSIFQQHVQKQLLAYKQNGDWKAKDAAVYLVTAMSIQQSAWKVAKTGVSGTQMIDVVPFFETDIHPELVNMQGAGHAILTADAIKFVSSFRKQIPQNHYADCIKLLSEAIMHDSEVVMTYAASAIERLLAETNEAKTGPAVSKDEVGALAGVLFQKLFTVLQRQTRENHYLLLCIMRVIRSAQEHLSPYVASVLSPLREVLTQVSKNPTNPAYNHYLFESISGLIKYNPATVGNLEQSLFSNFAAILQQDVVEFMPYVFQILAQMLELRTDVPNEYGQLLDLLCSPELYKHKGTIPAAIRFICVFIEKIPEQFNEQLVQRCLGIFQLLIKSKTLDHEAFALATQMVSSLPYPVLKAALPLGILFPIFAQLSSNKTAKLCRMFVLFLSVFVLRHGADEIISLINPIQPGIWEMVYNNVWIKFITTVEGTVPEKTVRVAFIKLLTESQCIQQPTQADMWGAGLGALLGLMLGQKTKETGRGRFDFKVHAADALGSTYTNSYCPLSCAAKSSVDYCSNVSNVNDYFRTQFNQVSSKGLPHFTSTLKAALSAEQAAAFSSVTGLPVA
eukprot:TRINITY_DN232_c0_g2_i5.p1 TRINITY_DN232_c0_g2~~TRINITY_DN232_c0_g2_i5.p1  ORF type:complete len:1444 (+),score=584.74 TRINITY_DN232_c0_g2_i5:69-4400(+)